MGQPTLQAEPHAGPALSWGTLTDTGTSEKLQGGLKLVFTQKFVPFSWWHGLESFIRGGEDCVDPVPVQRLRQPCSLDGGHQHAVGTHTENVTCLGGPSLSLIYLPTVGSWGPEHWGSDLHPTHKKGQLIPVCISSPKC